MPVIPDTDSNPLSVKRTKNGYRIMRGSGANNPYVFVRPGEVIALADHLIDAMEQES